MAIKERPLGNHFPREDFPSISQVIETVLDEEKRVIAKTKDELAVEWFLAHPEDMEKTGRELEAVLLEGMKLSYKTWNESKKKVRASLGK